MAALDVQQVLRLPAGMGAETATVFQRPQKCMAQERLLVRHQGIPFLRRNGGQTVQNV
ncbi:hypothetical protein D3C71_1768240 [compost metagenome]